MTVSMSSDIPAAAPSAARILVPILLLLGLLGAALAGVLALAASRENAAAARASAQLVQAAFTEWERRLTAFASDFALREAAAHPERRAIDRVVLERELAGWAHGTLGFTDVLVVDWREEIAFASSLGQPRGWQVGRPAQGRTLELARAIGGSIAPAGPPAPVYGYLRSPSGATQLAIAIAAPWRPYAAEPADRAAVLLMRSLDDELLKEFGDRLLVRGLRLDLEPGSHPSVALRDRQGAVVADVTWSPERPGDDLLRGLIAPMIVCFALAGLLVAPVVGPARRSSAAMAKAYAAASRLNRELATQEARFRSIAEALPVAAAITRAADGQLLFANARTLGLFGISDADSLPTLNSPAFYVEQEQRVQLLRRIDAAQVLDDQEVEFRRADGSRFAALVTARRFDFAGEAAYFAIVADVTERRRVEEQRLLQAAAIEAAANAIFITDQDGRICWTNRAAERMTGYAADEVMGRTPKFLASGKMAPEFWRGFWSTISAGQPWRGYVENLRKDGARCVVHQTVTPLQLPDGRRFFVAVHEDVSAQLAAEENIRRMALHDALTNLPNRRFLTERIEQAQAESRRSGADYALMLLDLDDFKSVNDTLGHAAGDHLLVQAAARIRSAIRETDTLARLGGDEFAVLVPALSDPAEASLAARRIVDELRAPFVLDGHEVRISGSVGIALARGAEAAADQLLREADIAMYEVKRNGRNGYRFFDAAVEQRVRARRALAEELRVAVAERKLSVCYQPQVEIGPDRACNVRALEALVRWPRAVGQEVSPAVFIPVAEEIGLTASITEFVLDSVCADLAGWLRGGVAPERIAVNFSALEFEQDDLVGTLSASAARHNVPLSCIEIEITESVAMARSPKVMENMEAVRDCGLSLAIDDFGTGHSSLTYLSRFPVRRLKIDKSFVAGIGQSRGDEVIVSAVIDLGHALGIRVLAEGVETNDQLEFLRRHGCDEAQGYLFGRAVPPEVAREAFASGDESRKRAG